VRDKKYWLSSIALSVGVLVHESILIIGLPSVLFFAFVQFTNGAGSEDIQKTPSRLVYTLLKISLMPIIFFIVLSISQYYFIDQGYLLNNLINHLSRFSFIKENRQYIVPRTLTTPFTDYLIFQSPDFIKRITQPIHLFQIGLPLIYFFYFVRQLVQEYSKKNLLFLLLLIITIMPLTLHIIAWDTSRIWTYPLVVVFLGIWALSENKMIQFHPNRKIEYSLCTALLLSQIYFQIPLMDNLSERFLPAIRIILIMPSIIFIIGNVYKLGKSKKEK